MTKEECIMILKDVADFPDEILEMVWDKRPTDELSESRLRVAAALTAIEFNIPMRIV